MTEKMSTSPLIFSEVNSEKDVTIKDPPLGDIMLRISEVLNLKKLESKEVIVKTPTPLKYIDSVNTDELDDEDDPKDGGHDHKSTKGNFRVASKHFLLTYKTHIDKDELSLFLNKIKENCGVLRFIAAHETADKKNPYSHTHAYVCFEKKFESTDCRIFDYFSKIMDGMIHPHIRICGKNLRNLFMYLAKEDPANAYLKKECQKIALKVSEYKTVQEMFLDLDVKPTEVMGYTKLFDLMKKKPDEFYVHKFKEEDFNYPLIKDKFTCMFVSGPPNTCKTQWAVLHFRNPLIVGQNDTLKKFRPGFHDGIVFDDVSYNHVPREAFIQICDWDEDRECYGRNTNAFIPAHTPKIFVSNKTFYEATPHSDDDAIKRRFSHFIEVIGPLSDNELPKIEPKRITIGNKSRLVISNSVKKLNDAEKLNQMLM
jgi:hypothetical protein